MTPPLVETEPLSVLLAVAFFPWLVYFGSAFWPAFEKNPTRCFLELWTGINICLLVYSNWVYVFTYILVAFFDIFVTDVSVHFGVIFFYLHQSITVIKGPNPYLVFLVLVMAACRLKRCVYVKPVTIVKPTRLGQFVPVSVTQPSWYTFLQF